MLSIKAPLSEEIKDQFTDIFDTYHQSFNTMNGCVIQ
jgi:hypothetical protein